MLFIIVAELCAFVEYYKETGSTYFLTWSNFLFLILGVFIARGKEDALVTYNLVIGESVYGEKRISVEVLTSKFKVLFFCKFVVNIPCDCTN